MSSLSAHSALMRTQTAPASGLLTPPASETVSCSPGLNIEGATPPSDNVAPPSPLAAERAGAPLLRAQLGVAIVVPSVAPASDGGASDDPLGDADEERCGRCGRTWASGKEISEVYSRLRKTEARRDQAETSLARVEMERSEAVRDAKEAHRLLSGSVDLALEMITRVCQVRDAIAAGREGHHDDPRSCEWTCA